MTCVGSTKEDIDKLCSELETHNIYNVLALRGDRPKDMSDEQYNNRNLFMLQTLLRD